LQTAPWATIVPSIVNAAERDPDLAALQQSLHCEMRAAFRLIVERARQRGEMARDIDPSEVIAAVLGRLFYGRCFRANRWTSLWSEA
jgi:Tetracyclin repressor-like, C-terminal domain